jgi:hypothetical protein
MKTLIRISLVLLSPYLLIVYWRNTMKEVGDIHAALDLNYE